ncbi:MAG: hypothetical protein WA880_06095 [Ornithinimicrobium sp.]
MIFLYFLVAVFVSLLLLGRAVTPRSQKKRFHRMQLDDYGMTLIRGVRLLSDAGARNRWRMENLQKQADYSEKGRMDGDRLPTDHAPHPREQMPPGAIPPHLRPLGGQPMFRPDDWVGANEPGSSSAQGIDSPMDDPENGDLSADDSNGSEPDDGAPRSA